MECRGSNLSPTGQSTLLLEPSSPRFIDLIVSPSLSLYFLFPIAPSFFVLLVVPSFCSRQPTWLLTLQRIFDSFWLWQKNKEKWGKRTGGLAGLWTWKFVSFFITCLPFCVHLEPILGNSLLSTWLLLFKLLLMHFIYYFLPFITYSLRQDMPSVIPVLQLIVQICIVCKHWICKHLCSLFTLFPSRVSQRHKGRECLCSGSDIVENTVFLGSVTITNKMQLGNGIYYSTVH